MIEANISAPRYHYSQVLDVLRPIPDIADQMGVQGLGIFYDVPDPILS